MKRTLPWLLTAIVGGVLWGLCFGKQPGTFLSWVALVPLLALLGRPRRQAVLLVWLHAAVAWLVSIPWIVHTLGSFGGLSPAFSWLLMVLLAAYLGSYQLVFAFGAWSVWQRGGWVAWLGIPAWWVSAELLRSWLLSGFPWNLTAYAWVDVPGALPLSAWIGSHGVSLLVLLANTGLALALLHPASREQRAGASRYRAGAGLAGFGLLVPALLLIMGGRWAVPSLDNNGFESTSFQDASRTVETTIPVRVLQPDIPNMKHYDAQQARWNLAKMLRMSEQACDVPGALLIWPESAGWPYLLEAQAGGETQLRQALDRLIHQRGCGVLLNSNAYGDGDDVFNAAYLLNTDGGLHRYDKQHLVPFGEYVPFAEALPFIGKIARSAGNFRAGDDPKLLPWRTATGPASNLGVAICYEAVFPAQVATQVQAGADVLVTISNDAWYGDSAALPQHFRAARFRAAENRRPLLRAAITGISAVIAADGSIVSHLDAGEEGTLRARVDAGRSASGLSPYTRAPWLVPAVCWLLACLTMIYSSRPAGRGPTVATATSSTPAQAEPHKSAELQSAELQSAEPHKSQSEDPEARPDTEGASAQPQEA